MDHATHVGYAYTRRPWEQQADHDAAPL